MYGYHDKGKAILIVLADHANKRGGDARPSVARIGALADLCESQVRKDLRLLRDGEWIIPVGNRSGGAPGASVSYQINCGKLYPPALELWEKLNRKGSLHFTPIAKDTPVLHDTPIPEAREGCTAGADGSPAGAPTPVLHDTQSVLDPSISGVDPARAGAGAKGAPPPHAATRDDVERFAQVSTGKNFQHVDGRRFMVTGAHIFIFNPDGHETAAPLDAAFIDAIREGRITEAPA